ncbi:hypothetical protein [Microvirga yunnanensis]|uniref:hypothetical protein n=1 Tax=Microvirga yunnanensis TaxID=2953740 RepID=UPI0021CAA1A0|nr:hypothetical protein [Microvirga sp. HBU65207]
MSILVAPSICTDACCRLNEEIADARLAVAIFGYADATSAIGDERSPGSGKDHL